MRPPKTREGKRVPTARALFSSAKYLGRALRLVYRSSAGMTFALVVLTLFAAAAPPAIAWAGKHIVDAVVARSRDETVRWVVVELGLVTLQATLTRGLALVRSVLGGRLGTDVNVAILEKATRLDLAHFEDPDFYDKLTRARREASSRPVSLVSEGFALVQNLLTLAGYAALLLPFSGYAILVLVAATIPATIAEMRYSKTAFRLRNWRSPDSRRLLYLEHVLANDEHVKEVKLFRLGPLFLERYKGLAERFYREDSRLAVRRSLVTHALSLIATLSFYGAYAAMATAAALGRLTLGNMTMYVLAFRNGQQAFHSILNGVGSIYEHNLYMSNLFDYLDSPETFSGQGAPPARNQNGTTAERGIRLEGVSFRYPGQEEWVLRDVDLFIPEGQSVALVGQNGAGKTTLIKLITGLYEPTEGRILLDGKDLRLWDERALLARFGVVFQDYNQYQLKVRENVGVGSVDYLDDAPRLERAIVRGGAKSVVEALPEGIETQLGRWFQDGTELSGGQWQKLALARGFMREHADILVLDEPTAALDAEAEHAVFERFKTLAEGRTTIIISHRFPTVRMADRILLLEDGRVQEDGTHAELLNRAHTYARLYRLQAEGYV